MGIIRTKEKFFSCLRTGEIKTFLSKEKYDRREKVTKRHLKRERIV